MAWSTPTSRAAGYTVTHTVWNQDVVENPIALRAGAIAISGQAAEALIKASSASQLSTVTVPARGAILYAGASGAPGWLAAGTSGYVLTAAGAGADPAWGALPATAPYLRDVSVTEVVSTLAETSVFSGTVSGGALSTNKALRITLIGDHKNNCGGARGLKVRVKLGTTTLLLLDTGTSIGSNNARNVLMMSADISALNSASAQVASGRLTLSQDANGTDGAAHNASLIEVVAVHSASVEDTATDKTLAITFEHTHSDAQLSAKAFTVQVELI